MPFPPPSLKPTETYPPASSRTSIPPVVRPSMATGTKLLRFFKVLLGDFSHQLLIPPAFLRHIPAEADEILLRNPQGRSWQVATRRSEGDVFLAGEGWSDFVEDSGLREFEFLVFEYDRTRSCFDVRVFETSCCEREVEAAAVGERRKRRKKPLMPPKRRRTRSGRFDCTSRRQREAEETAAFDCDVPGKGNHVMRNAETNFKVEDNTIEISDEEEEQPLRKGRNGYMPSSVGAATFTSRHPFVAIFMGRNYVGRPYTLKIPEWFSRKHMPKSKHKLIFRDPREKAWEVVYTPPTRGISAGWKAFFEGNGIEFGDTCVFELIAPNQLRVHIFPGEP